MSLFNFRKGKTTEITIDLLIQKLSWIFLHLDSQNVKELDGEGTNLTGSWDFVNVTAINNLITNTVSDHDHNIPDGTVLNVSGGGTVTFNEDGEHSHDVTV